jgi:hypothetical protein
MESIRPVPKEAKMNKAAGLQEKTGHEPAAKAAKPGNETKADMKGAILGNPTDKSPLHGAVRELHAQHPHPYHDHGPHHGTTTHIRHQPLHGLKP